MCDYAEYLTRLDTLRRITHDACLKKNWNEVRENAERINDVALDLIDLSRKQMENNNG